MMYVETGLKHEVLTNIHFRYTYVTNLWCSAMN